MLPSGLTATANVDPSLLGPILSELRAEECGHSWRTPLVELGDRPPDELVTALLERARAYRPTDLYTYTLRGEPMAIATISDRVTSAFPHDGFPVLARCYIRRKYRDAGLYHHLVQHRLAICEDRFGDSLRAIHMGASDIRVEQTLRHHPDLYPRFVHVGDERLMVAGRAFYVQDFVAFTPRYGAELRQAGIDVARFVEFGHDGIPWSALKKTMPETPATVALRDLLEAIPVIT